MGILLISLQLSLILRLLLFVFNWMLGTLKTGFYVPLVKHQSLGEGVLPRWNETLHVVQPLFRPRRRMFRTAAFLPLLIKPLLRNRFLSPLPGVLGHSDVYTAMKVRVKVLLYSLMF